MDLRIPRIALVGANGYGLWHRHNIEARRRAGDLELVALCDTAAIADPPEAPIGDTPVYDDYQRMIAETGPSIVIIASPPPTHLPVATAAMRAGADVYLEKPPVASMKEYDELYAVMTETGQACQIGFQALGSDALDALTDAIATGRLGELRAVGVAGSWRRPDSYYRRSPWAGKRELGGTLVADGALANPFAHATQQALAIAGDWPLGGEVELQRLRCRAEIEVDDTAVWRGVNKNGVTVTVAVTLCGDTKIEGDIYVRGTAGEAWLQYPTDLLRLPGEDEPRKYGRTDLLENLIHHRQRGSGLVSGLRRARTFTGVLERVLGDPMPRLVDEAHLRRVGADDPVTILDGADRAVEEAAREGKTFTELGYPWA